MAIDLLAIDFATGEERGNILICRPVNGNAKVITILRLEVGLVLFIVEPVVTEPVEVRELLVGKLIELLVGSGGELLPMKSSRSRPGLVTSLPSLAMKSVRLRTCWYRQCVPMRSESLTQPS